MALSDKNLFAYCDNNSINRSDNSGHVWETVFDIVTLGASIIEVIVTPTDPWAWVSLGGDIIDLIPFVTGVGEAAKVAKATKKPLLLKLPRLLISQRTLVLW